MHLYVPSGSPLNSNFTNEDGQVLYKVETPKSLTTRISTITYVVPNDVPHKNGDTVDMHDTFGHLAQIEHKVVGPSVLRFEGKEIESKDYFRKEGWGPYTKHRVFTGPDGREYKWILGSFTPKLIINDGTKAVVARFHRRSLGIIGKAQPASLEIFTAGENMVKEILITFIYIEKKRKDKETAVAVS